MKPFHPVRQSPMYLRHIMVINFCQYGSRECPHSLVTHTQVEREMLDWIKQNNKKNMHFCINKFLALGFSSQPQTRNIRHTEIKRL